MTKKCILCILDGWGIAPPSAGNPIDMAKPKTYQYLLENFPNTTLSASGPSVGLPENQDGNSETGHLNIGAGRTIYQDLSLINMSIADGSFFTNKALLDTVKHIKSFDSKLHLLGMIGASGVHSSNEHLYALLLFAKRQNLQKVYLHLITDGRDSPPDNSLEQITIIKQKIKEIGLGEIVTVVGRYYAMDRDQRWDRTQQAYDCLVNIPTQIASSPEEYIKSSYQSGHTDEFMSPMAIKSTDQNTRIQAADAVIFFNFRTDRPRQLTELFLTHPLPNLRFVTMTRYKKEFTNPSLFASQTVVNTLGEVISKKHLKQLRMAETEKIAMVTYFFNGQSEDVFENEEREFVASPKVATYDLVPEMSTSLLIQRFKEKYLLTDYKLAVLNIACPDMVAHTGKIDKTIEAIKAADSALAQLTDLAKETNSYLVITADHGNAEELINHQSGKVDTEHSNSPVPLIIYHPTDNQFKLVKGKLGDIAPTILNLLEVEKPIEMSGNNLVIARHNLRSAAAS